MIKTKRTAMLLAGLIFVAAAGLHGARPFSVDDAGTLAPAAYELEAGIDYWADISPFSIGFKHGLTAKMDLGIGIGYDFNAEEVMDRFGAMELCLKYNFIPDFISASLATTFQEKAYCVNGIFTRSMGNLEFDGNLGFNAAENTMTFGCALIYSLMDGWNIGMEAIGDNDGPGGWLIGMNYSIIEPIRFDVGFASGFNLDTKSVNAGIHSEF